MTTRRGFLAGVAALAVVGTACSPLVVYGPDGEQYVIQPLFMTTSIAGRTPQQLYREQDGRDAAVGWLRNDQLTNDGPDTVLGPDEEITFFRLSEVEALEANGQKTYRQLFYSGTRSSSSANWVGVEWAVYRGGEQITMPHDGDAWDEVAPLGTTIYIFDPDAYLTSSAAA